MYGLIYSRDLQEWFCFWEFNIWYFVLVFIWVFSCSVEKGYFGNTILEYFIFEITAIRNTCVFI